MKNPRYVAGSNSELINYVRNARGKFVLVDEHLIFFWIHGVVDIFRIISFDKFGKILTVSCTVASKAAAVDNGIWRWLSGTWPIIQTVSILSLWMP